MSIGKTANTTTRCAEMEGLIGKEGGERSYLHLLEFSDGEISETFDINENVLVEIDKNGRVVSMTVEHAKEQMDVREFSYQLASA